MHAGKPSSLCDGLALLSHPLRLSISLPAFLLPLALMCRRQDCRCSAVSTDSILAFVAVGEDDASEEGSRSKAEERQFRGSHVPDLATLAETGGAGADGVCGCVFRRVFFCAGCFRVFLFFFSAVAVGSRGGDRSVRRRLRRIGVSFFEGIISTCTTTVVPVTVVFLLKTDFELCRHVAQYTEADIVHACEWPLSLSSMFGHGLLCPTLQRWSQPDPRRSATFLPNNRHVCYHRQVPRPSPNGARGARALPRQLSGGVPPEPPRMSLVSPPCDERVQGGRVNRRPPPGLPGE